LTDDATSTVRITLRDVYDGQREMQSVLATLAERLPAHVEKTDKAIERVENTQADHEKRLRAIETRMWIAVGALTLITVFMNTATKFLNL
jgi:hypothetical protein